MYMPTEKSCPLSYNAPVNMHKTCEGESCAWYRGTDKEGACSVWSTTEFLMGTYQVLNNSLNAAIKILEAKGIIKRNEEKTDE
jgi:hypothetical protein